jgi:hypothetical protein
MSISAADESARQLNQSVRQLIAVVHEQTNVARAALPQFFGAQELAKRWNCSHDQVIATLGLICGYKGERGHRLSVSLEDVLRCDQHLKQSYDARKRQGVAV